MPAGLSIDFALDRSGLNVFIYLRIGTAHIHGIGPRFIHPAKLHLREDGEIIIMETLAIRTYIGPLRLIPNLYPFHRIVVFRIVHTQCRSDQEATLWRYPLRIQVCPMRVERTNAVRGIQIVFSCLIGDDIDRTSQGISP